jgi:N-acylneuraminate cytidylyltransferase
MLGRPLFTGINRSHFSNLTSVYVFTDDVEIIEFVEREYHWTSKVKTLRNNEMPTIQPQPKVQC